MNEIMARKYLKKVMAYGVNKAMAHDIVETAMTASKGRNVDTYIDYALILVYGLNTKSRAK